MYPHSPTCDTHVEVDPHSNLSFFHLESLPYYILYMYICMHIYPYISEYFSLSLHIKNHNPKAVLYRELHMLPKTHQFSMFSAPTHTVLEFSFLLVCTFVNGVNIVYIRFA